jgi:hypothetical protein
MIFFDAACRTDTEVNAWVIQMLLARPVEDDGFSFLDPEKSFHRQSAAGEHADGEGCSFESYNLLTMQVEK